MNYYKRDLNSYFTMSKRSCRISNKELNITGFT